VDIHIHDTYFIVGHIHYVLFTGSLFAAFAGIYYWYPKMFGRAMNETLGKIHFAATFIAANVTFFPMHILGVGGLPRRYAAYEMLGDLPGFHHFHDLNKIITMAAFSLGVVQIIFFANFIGSLFAGKQADRNPWHANTLEWEAPSPPPHGNFEQIPTVYRGPYEYASPEVQEDYLPQTRKL
jgi:cytochrome c oxidase subunit 1